MSRLGGDDKRPYRFIRVTWFKKYDLKELSSELGTEFTIIRPFVHSQDWYLSRELGSFLIKADTLYALVETDKATLFQKDTRPFTKKDLQLRQRIFSLYPYMFIAPSPSFLEEPHFEVQ